MLSLGEIYLAILYFDCGKRSNVNYLRNRDYGHLHSCLVNVGCMKK